jgi:hypothetical protein
MTGATSEIGPFSEVLRCPLSSRYRGQTGHAEEGPFR